MRKKLAAAVLGFGLALGPATVAQAAPAMRPAPSGIAVVTAGSSYYPPTTSYMSRAQVKTTYKYLKVEDNICKAIGMAQLAPAWAGCGSPSSLKDAVTAAALTGKRVRMDYYIHKSIMSLNYYKYTVVS